MLSPCKDCPDRALHCHSRCEKYQVYAEWCEARREKRKQEQAADEAAARRGEKIRRDCQRFGYGKFGKS